MDIETATIESIEAQLLADEAQIGRLRASQLVLLREVDRRQMPPGNVEWSSPNSRSAV